MTVNKKDSRKIVIDNEIFMWAISPGSGYLVLVAEYACEKGRRIEVYITSDINGYWTNFPEVSEMNLKVIKPKDVETMIKQAIKDGWNPKERGKPITYDYKEEKMIKRI